MVSTMTTCPGGLAGVGHLGPVELTAESNNLEAKYDPDQLRKAREVCILWRTYTTIYSEF